MLKKAITFEDFDGETKTEVHYFNLTKTELIEMEVGAEGGSLAGQLQATIKKNSAKDILALFKMIILKSYGIRNGNGFHKNEEFTKEFESSLAYDALFSELVTSATGAAEFVTALVPKELIGEMTEDETPIVNVELPEEPSEDVPWANREPTQQELVSMTREQLMAVFQRKSRG